MRLALLLLVTSLATSVMGCAHESSARSAATQTTERKLLVLESQFADFVAVWLDRDEDASRAAPLQMLASVERQTARLEGLRLRYLDVIEDASTHRQRVIAMVRIAELHLDLASRVRRLPYPADSDRSQRRVWDDDLSRRALPLEAVGLGVLEQVNEYAEHRALDGRFIRRARVYLALHASRRLGDEELSALRRELGATGPFGPAPRLLSAGRVGQRAARR